jgi:hypothetical protein
MEYNKRGKEMSTTLVNKERFIPSRLSNLAVWLDAADSNTFKIAPSSTNITQWEDKSGNSNTFFPEVLPPTTSYYQTPNPTVLSQSWSTIPYNHTSPVYITLGLDGYVYGYSDEPLFFRIPSTGGPAVTYISGLPFTTEVAGITCLQSDGKIYTVGNSLIGRINQGKNPSFDQSFMSLPTGTYVGLSSTNNFLYTVDVVKGTLFQINPALEFVTVVYTAPDGFTLTGFVACAQEYIYVGYTQVNAPGVTLTQLTQNIDGTVNNPNLLWSGTFPLQDPLGLVATSDNTVYITDLIAPFGANGDIVTLKIPTDGIGNIVLPVNTSWLTFSGNQNVNIRSLFVGTDGNLYIPIDTPSVYQIAKVQPFTTVAVTSNYYGPTYSNIVPSPYVSFTYGGGLKSANNSGLTGSKSILMVYNCPATSNSMNVQVGVNVSGGAFGLAQKSGLAYTPFQYGTGDFASPPESYTGINYAFASFDASSNNTVGGVGFNLLNLQAAAFPNNIADSPLRVGDPSNIMYTASGFRVYELVATSNAISTSDRQEMEAYFSAKWGLTLPVGHPYSNFQPSGDQWIPIGLPATISGLVSWLDMTIPGQTGTSIADSTGGSFTLVGNPLSLSNINNHPSLYFPGSGNAYLSRTGVYPATGSALFVFSIADNRPGLPIIAFSGISALVYTAPTLSIENGNFPSVDLTTGPNLVFFAWSNSNYYLSANGGPHVVGGGNTAGASTNFFIGGNLLATNIPTMNFGEIVVYSQYFEQSERQLLEGYLSWKWNIEGKLPEGHPYALESPIGATVTELSPLNIPAQIPSLVTWLDAADSGTIAQAGSNVTWYDKSATSDVFEKFGTNLQPTYTSTPIGSVPPLPALYFSGTSSLVGKTGASIGSGTGSCFLVATILGNAQVLMGGFQAGNVVEGNSFGFYFQGSSAVSPIQGWSDIYMNTFVNATRIGPCVFFGQIDVVGPKTDGQGSFQFSTPPSSQGTNKAFMQAYTPFKTPWILGTAPGSPLSQNFYVHEFLCFSDYFTDSQRQLVEGYLAWKWGIQSQLPSGHPYASARPQSA